MIVVVGTLACRTGADGRLEAAGRAAAIAIAAAAAGAEVQLVGRIGEDAAGDGLVVALGRAGVGHAALLRDPARPTPLLAPDEPAGLDAEEEPSSGLLDEPEELGGSVPLAPAYLPADPSARPALEPADLELALGYLPGIRVAVVAETLGPELLRAVAAGAAFSSAQLVVVLDPGSDLDATTALLAALGQEGATLLAAPPRDPGEAFARLVATFAAGLDAGRAPEAAFTAAVAAAGWEAASA